MSKQLKLKRCLFLIDSNQLITVVVFPFFEVAFFRDCAVDAVEDLFADFAYLGFREVDESAGKFVCELRQIKQVRLRNMLYYI